MSEVERLEFEMLKRISDFYGYKKQGGSLSVNLYLEEFFKEYDKRVKEMVIK